MNDGNKKYDLEERTFLFAQRVRYFVPRLEKCQSNIEDSKQVIRSSGSVAANYIEANEALSKKDFLVRIKICRKEAKETRLWLNLLMLNGNKELEKEKDILFQEATELMKIFGAIIDKSQ